MNVFTELVSNPKLYPCYSLQEYIETQEASMTWSRGQQTNGQQSCQG